MSLHHLNNLTLVLDTLREFKVSLFWLIETLAFRILFVYWHKPDKLARDSLWYFKTFDYGKSGLRESLLDKKIKLKKVPCFDVIVASDFERYIPQ